MPDYDAGFKIVAHVSSRGLAELGGVHCRSLHALTGEVQATQRLADRVFRGETESEKFVVYMEAYTRWQDSAVWSVLAKSGLLAEQYRLPVVSLVYILLPRGYRDQHGSFRLEAAGGPTNQVWFREVRLWEQEPQPWWEESPGLMALYPLCHHGRSRKEAIMLPAQLIKQRVADRKLRADLLTTLGIFGRLSSPGIDVFPLIGREQMKESTLYEEIMDEGRVEARRDDIRQVLEERIGAEAAGQFQVALQNVTDLAELSRLLRMAARCRRPSDFRRALQS